MKGLILYNWLASFSRECETDVEYRRSHNELTRFLSRPDTMSILKRHCVQSVMELQSNLASKQAKLAGHIRADRKCSMDASTTSPAESQNHSIKHHGSYVNSRMRLSTSMSRVVDGITNKNLRRKNAAIRELGKITTFFCCCHLF